ncbi:acyl carrier protein [Nannocystaceae bacterium ST9]
MTGEAATQPSALSTGRTIVQNLVNAEEITAQVRAEIAAGLRQRVEDVGLDARLDGSELGLDSLAFIKLSVRLEELFDITMPDLAASEAAVGSVRDVAALVVRQLAAREGGGAR